MSVPSTVPTVLHIYLSFVLLNPKVAGESEGPTQVRGGLRGSGAAESVAVWPRKGMARCHGGTHPFPPAISAFSAVSRGSSVVPPGHCPPTTLAMHARDPSTHLASPWVWLHGFPPARSTEVHICCSGGQSVVLGLMVAELGGATRLTDLHSFGGGRRVPCAFLGEVRPFSTVLHRRQAPTTTLAALVDGVRVTHFSFQRCGSINRHRSIEASELKSDSLSTISKKKLSAFEKGQMGTVSFATHTACTS